MKKKETETKLNDGFDIKKKTKVVSLEETPKPKTKRKRRTKVDKVESIEYVSNDNQTLSFVPSKYQQAIFDFISHGVGNAVINATAGSGKTSTLVNALRLINSDLSVLFIAFNKDIVTELKKKIGSDLQNVTVSTVHSIGFSMLRRNFFGNNFTVDQFKYKTYIKKHLSALTTMDLFNFSKSKKANYLDNIITLVDLGRCYLAQSDKELVKIADTYGIDLIGDETQVVLNVLEWGSTNLDTIDFGDMVWLPYELDLQPKGLQYDFVFCDECQDISDVQRELFLRCFKKGTRFVGIGDEKQSIYGFNGANSLSFKNLQNLPNTINLPLSITYRCPKKVVNYVKKYVPEIEARSDAPEGEIVYDVKIKDVEDNSMVLCRNKMPLVMLYMRYLRMGKQAYIRGKDIGLNLINMINCTDKELLNQDMKADGVFVRLYENLFDTRNRLMAKRGLDIKDATLSDSVISQYDSIKALEVLSEGLQTANELRLRIQTVFGEDKLGICLSTIHKAKGLEADNVYIACRSLMPSMMAEQEWELQQEDNLQYVAYTRTKYKLGFISEKELSPMAGLIEVNSTLKDLSYIETIVCRILKKVAINPMDSAEMGKLQISNSAPLEKPKVNVASLTNESENDEDNDDSFDEMMKLLKEKGGLKKLKEFLKS